MIAGIAMVLYMSMCDPQRPAQCASVPMVVYRSAASAVDCPKIARMLDANQQRPAIATFDCYGPGQRPPYEIVTDPEHPPVISARLDIQEYVWDNKDNQVGSISYVF